MRRAPFILVASLMLFVGASGCSERTSNEVVAVEKTDTYHRPDCRLVSMARTETITVAEAKAQHLKPCPVCKPDTL